MEPLNHSDAQHGMIILRVQWWHACVGGNQQLSDWTSDPLQKKGTRIGTGDLVNYSVLVRSWLLKENEQPLTY